jgi:hypothetical protein
MAAYLIAKRERFHKIATKAKLTLTFARPTGILLQNLLTVMATNSHATDLITQRELQSLRRMLRNGAGKATGISERLANGAAFEPGHFAFEGGQVVRRGTKRKLDRLRIMGRLLDPEDFAFVSSDRSVLPKLRRARSRVFRRYLAHAGSETLRSYRVRLDRIRAVHAWSRAYPALLSDTAMTIFCLGKLRVALWLFAWRMPAIIDVARNVDRLVSYASTRPSYAGSTS